jgi:flagellar protein FlaJ
MMVNLEMSKDRKVLLISILISSFLIFIGIISGIQGVLGNTIILSVFLVITPQLIFSYVGFKEMKEIELRFPHFLRDLVETTRAGMPLHKAIIFASHADYGPLSSEIKKMANQLSWNVNILKVLDQFKKRLKKSKTLTRVIRIIIETYKSGGAIDETLNSLSSTLMTIQETEKDRKSMLNQYVIAMYVISIVFIGIIIGINWLMVPVFESLIMPSASEGSVVGIITNPCAVCLNRIGGGCTPCNFYFSICSIFGVKNTGISCYYLALFFSITVMQAIMGGLVAGQIGEDSIKAGFKHSIILLGVTIGAFFILVYLGLMGG